MNNKTNNKKEKIINLGKKNNKEIKNGKHKENGNNSKKIIESYNTKNSENKFMNKIINLETNITFDKKNNLSIFSFLSSNTNNKEEKTNKNSLKISKENEKNQFNLKYKNINNKKKFFLNSNKINLTNKQKTKIDNNRYNNMILTKELDKFKIRIDNLMKVIEDFEIKYINSNENKKIKKELDIILKDKKYLEESSFLISKKNLNIKSQQKPIFYRGSNKSIFNKGKNNNKTVILKNQKLFLLNNSMPENKYCSSKNIKINSSIISNKKEQKEKKNNKDLNKNNNIKNSYNRRIDYNSLIEVKSKNKEKTKNYKKQKKKKKSNKDIIKKNKPITFHYPSKSNNIKSLENIYNNDKKNQEKEVISNSIYINSSYNKTPKIYRIKEKINKIEKPKSNYNYSNKTKKI